MRGITADAIAGTMLPCLPRLLCTYLLVLPVVRKDCSVVNL